MYLCCELWMTELRMELILTRYFAILKISDVFHDLFFIGLFNANVNVFFCIPGDSWLLRGLLIKYILKVLLLSNLLLLFSCL